MKRRTLFMFVVWYSAVYALPDDVSVPYHLLATSEDEENGPSLDVLYWLLVKHKEDLETLCYQNGWLDPNEVYGDVETTPLLAEYIPAPYGDEGRKAHVCGR